MVAGWWVTADFDSQYKIFWESNLGPWGRYLPIHKKNKVQNKNLHNYSHPQSYQTYACGGGGVPVHCTSAVVCKYGQLKNSFFD